MPSLVSDVHAVAEELALRSPAAVGSSLGGTIADRRHLPAVHPARALVTVDVSLRFDDFAQLIRPFAHRLEIEGLLQSYVVSGRRV